MRIALASGHYCELRPVRMVFLRHYYVLCFPRGEPTAREAAEMFAIATQTGAALSPSRVGCADAYTVIYSGHAVRRASGWHLHLLLVPGRWSKAWLYLVLAGKNLLQGLGLRRDSGRPARGAPRVNRGWL